MPMIGFLLEINGGAVEAGILNEIRIERHPSTGNLSKEHYNTSWTIAGRLIPGRNVSIAPLPFEANTSVGFKELKVARIAWLLIFIYRRQANPRDDKSSHCGQRGHRESDFHCQGHVGVAMSYSAEDEQKNREQGHQNQKADYSADQTDRRG